jgi:hypothetical protein
MPNIRELQSLVDYGKNYPAIDNFTDGKFTFNRVKNGVYWSSTVIFRDSLTYEVWIVHFSHGSVSGSVLTQPRYLWPVRGGE